MIGNIIYDYNPFKLGLNALLYVNSILYNLNSKPDLYQYLKLPNEDKFINNYKVLIFNLDNIITNDIANVIIRDNFNKLSTNNNFETIIISNITNLNNQQIKKILIDKEYKVKNTKIISVQDVILSFIKKVIILKEDKFKTLKIGIYASNEFYNNIIVKIYKKYNIDDIKFYLINKNNNYQDLDYIFIEKYKNENENNNKKLNEWISLNNNIPIILSNKNININNLQTGKNTLLYLIKPYTDKLKLFIKNKYKISDSKKLLYITHNLVDDYDYCQKSNIDMAYITTINNIENILNIKDEIRENIKYILPDMSFLNYYKINK